MTRMDLLTVALILFFLLALARAVAAAGSAAGPAPDPEARESASPPGHRLAGDRQHGEPAHGGHGEQGQGHEGLEDQGHHHRHGTDGIHHDFSDVERWVGIFEGDDRDSWQQPGEVVRLLGLGPGMTVADLGAGSGYFLPYLSAAVGAEGKVLGLEPEPNFIALMKARAEENGWSNVEARRIPYDDPGLGGGSVDRILIVNTWHHIGDRGAYAAKLGRALKDGGEVFVLDFTKESPYGPSVESRLDPGQVIEELREGGLEAELVPTDLPWQYLVVARRP